MSKFVEDMGNAAGKKGIDKTIDLLVEKFINPKLEKILNAPQNIFVLGDLFNEYLKKKYEKDKYINTIVFQNESKTIDELYIPLTIIQNGRRNKSMILDEDMNNIFEEPNTLLIIDTAGTGKSTLVKFLSNLCIEKNWGIPFVIELRKLEKNQSLESYIISDIQLSNNNIKDVDIADIIRRGNFIFFLDGYDEILEENKKNVTKNIRDFITYADNNSFVLTSREDDGLSEFGNFIKHHIKELSKNEAYKLIQKYDDYGDTSSSLLEEIEKDENYDALKEFLGNPLMVSLLYLTYRHKTVLQYKKNIFYRQVYDALFDRHDTTKGVGVVHEKKSKLDSEDFRKVLCAMGFISIKDGKIEYTKDQIIKLINASKQIFPNITFNSDNFLQDILHAVPLFKKDGLNYKWTHKSFAEYFAAVFICQERKEYESKILNDILKTENNQRFYNMLDFCYDIDYKTVSENLILSILENYINFYDKNMGAKKDLILWEIHTFYKFIDNVYFIKIDNKNRPKNRNIITDYIEAVNILNQNNIYSFSYLNYISKSDNIIMMVQRTPVYEIVKLIFNKKIDIFKEVKLKELPMKFIRNLENIGIYNIFNPEGDDSWINNNFDAITSYIYHSNTDFRGKILDIDKCRNKIKEIKEEQDRISDDFFSLL